HGAAGLYPVLLRTYVSKFNWAYADGLEPLRLVQQSWAFTCHLLKTFGSQSRPGAFYAERFLLAFPAITRQAVGSSYADPEETVVHAYSLRALQRFLGFLGLATFDWERTEQFDYESTLVRTSLL